MKKRHARDHVEIAQAVQRYGQALDERRFELLDSVFTPDARLRYRMPTADGERPQVADGGLEQWRSLFRSFLAPFAWTQHLMSDPVVELDGDRARTVCRLLASHGQVRRSGGRNLWTVWGVYRDAWVRTESGWRIRERDFEGLHTEGRALPADEVESPEAIS